MNQTYHIVINQGRDGSITVGPFQVFVPFRGTGYIGINRDSKIAEPWYQWKFQDPKMEVLYHIRPYFLGIFPYIGLIYCRPYVW